MSESSSSASNSDSQPDAAPVPTLVDDAELTSLLDTYAALNRERAERAKGELRAGIASMRAELAASAPRAAPLFREQPRRMPTYIRASPHELRHWFNQTERKIGEHLGIYRMSDLIELSPGARRHVAVLFETTDPMHAKLAVRRRREYASSCISDDLWGWTVEHSRVFEPRESETAVVSAREAAEALLRWKIYSFDDFPEAVYADVCIATHVEAVHSGGGWQYGHYEMRESSGWGGASICAAIDYGIEARAYWVLVLPEIVWGCALPEALGPLACVTIPHPVTAGARDDEPVDQNGPRRGAVRALRFLLAASVDGKDTLMHAVATALRTESEIWRAQLNLNLRDTHVMATQLRATATATSSTASCTDIDGFSRSWSSEVRLLDTNDAWRQLGGSLRVRHE